MIPTLEDMSLATEPQLREALEAIRAHRDSEACEAPQEELARHRMLADSLCEAVVNTSCWCSASCRVPSLTLEAIMSRPDDILLPDHPLYAQAVEAMRKCHEAKDNGAPEPEVGRLRRIAQAQFQAVTEYQMRAFDKDDGTTH